jgi:hypothetical protein
MSDFLKYFMWGYQQHFLISVSHAAERLFTALDPELRPRMFLLGFRTDNDMQFEPICIEPEEFEDLGYEVADFVDVRVLAAAVEDEERAEGRFHSHPLAQQRYEIARRRRSWSEATRRVLEREDEARGWRSFVGFPVEVNNYQVICVLQLPRSVYDGYTRLRNELDDRFAVHSSFLEAVVDEFLRRCTEGLLLPEPGASLSVIDRSNEELLRNAGQRFVLTIPSILRSYDLLQGLYDALSELAGTRYEGATNHGRLILARKDNPHLISIVTLQREVSLMEARAARKLLEMTTEKYALLADGGKAFGLGDLDSSYDISREDAFLVEFLGEGTWHVSHAGIEFMRVRNGIPSLPAKPPREEKLVDTLERIFGTGPGTDVALVSALVRVASQQRHGTLVVISDHALEEAARLRAQATAIDPLPMTSDLMRSVTAIDGAVLLDPGGTCHALGVILDGMASAEGVPARGARFNSAVRYVRTATAEFGHRCVAVVVSEDGPVNVIPDLLRRISRAELKDKIEQLRTLGELKEVGRRDFYRLLDWLSEHRPYLSAEDAARIEEARMQIQPRLEKSDVWPVYNEFRGKDSVPDDLFTD